ncbi:MAG: hypothetical protein HY820_27555 [Acidobacteria bacterium]|nr:hypothetical protein [Acidobacteriota bacterium]
MSAGTLNIIFHGTFVFTRAENVPENTEKGIEVLIPKVKGHVYRIGNWLAETDLLGGRDWEPGLVYRLNRDAVTEGSAFLKPEHNLILEKKELKKAQDLNPRLIAKLVVPYPKTVSTPRRTDVGKQHLTGGDKPSKFDGRIGTLQVFSYDFTDDAELRLDYVGDVGPVWEPAFAGDPLVVNLHVIAAHEHAPLSARTERCQDTVLQKCFELFQNLDLKVGGVPDPNNSEFALEPLPEGVVREECEDLEPRTRRLAQAGRMKRDNRDLNQMWFESEALDVDADLCGSPGNGDGGGR